MAYVDEVAADSPLLWWRLGEVAGPTAVDASGNGKDGTYSADGAYGFGWPSLIDGDADTAFWCGRQSSTTNRFHVDRAASTDHAILNTGELTIEVRWKGSSLDGTLVWGGGNYMLTLDGGILRLRVGNDNTGPVLTGSRFVADDNPHSIVVHLAHDAGTATYLRRVTVDGVVDIESTASYAIASGAATTLRLGRYTPNNSHATGVYDEFALYDYLLPMDRVVAHWYTASGGVLYAQGLDLGLTMGTAHVQVGQWVPATGLDLGLTMGHHALSEPLRPGSISDPDDVPGPIGELVAGTIYPASAISESIVPGIRVAPPIEQAQPLYPASASSLSIVPGPWMPVSFVPTPQQPEPDVPIWVPVPPSPTYPTGQMLIEGRMMVSGTSRLLQAECTPTLNGVGIGTFTDHSSSIPAPGDSVVFSVAGKTVMTGSVGEAEDAEVSPDEEHGEVQRVSVRATAQELNDVLVLPEWGAMDVERLGSPIADTRVFDWTANGLGDWSGDGALYTPGATPVPHMFSSGVDILAADSPLGGPWDSAFPLPDVWPDNQSQWMNWISPRIPAPEGWALFRVPTPPPPPGHSVVQFWLCAWDYAELWCDGVKMVTCDTPGKAEHVEITGMGNDYHLLAIRLYTAGGAAGVMCTMLPVKWDRLYGPPIMNSRSGWITLPVHDAFIYTPGAVLNRLFYEAQERGNSIAKNWTLTFSNKNDSAGRPWPVPDWPIELDVGMSMLEVLNRLSETYIDWRERPGGRAIDAFVKGEGSGRSVNVPWTAGVDLDSRERTRAERE